MWQLSRRLVSCAEVVIWAVVLVGGGVLALFEWHLGSPEALTVSTIRPSLPVTMR
jgi:hypothetical protein